MEYIFYDMKSITQLINLGEKSLPYILLSFSLFRLLMIFRECSPRHLAVKHPSICVAYHQALCQLFLLYVRSILNLYFGILPLDQLSQQTLEYFGRPIFLIAFTRQHRDMSA